MFCLFVVCIDVLLRHKGKYWKKIPTPNIIFVFYYCHQLFLDRKLRQVQLDQSGNLPDFSADTQHIRDGDWQVSPVPKRLANRHIDLGDVSPANTQHFVAALNSAAQGIQVSRCIKMTFLTQMMYKVENDSVERVYHLRWEKASPFSTVLNS